MKKLFLVPMTFVVMSFFAACGGESGAGNTSKAANAAPSNANSAAAAPADPKAAEAEVRKVMEAIKAGLSSNNADAMDKVYADNYTFVGNDGTMMTKAERLAALRSGELKYTSFNYTEDKITVAADGNSAVGIFTISAKGMMKGKPMDGDTRTTGVFAKTKDGWKLASASNVKIEGGAAKADDKTKANANTAQKGASNAKTDALAVDDGGAPPTKKK